MRHRHTGRRITFFTFWQAVFMTGSLYLRNDLLNYSAACAFGFVFSFIPMAIMTMAILLRFLHASPETVASIISLNQYLDGIDSDITRYVNSLTTLRRVGMFEIVIGIFIVWMARRFFATIMASMKAIFHQESRIRYSLMQGIIFGCEILIVMLIVLFIFLYTSTSAIFTAPFPTGIHDVFPRMKEAVSSAAVRVFPNVASFLMCAVVFRVASHARPKWRFCFFSSLAQNISFAFVQVFMNSLMSPARYNIVYGMFAKMIVLLTELWIYFTLFLIFAEYTYVLQNFRQLLLTELYLLPRNAGLGARIWRALFLRADYLFAEAENVVTFSRGDRIYKKGSPSDCVYYVIRGTVRSDSRPEDGAAIMHGEGEFFGEITSILNKSRVSTVTAESDVTLLRVGTDTFMSIVENKHRASTKALDRVSSYLTEAAD